MKTRNGNMSKPSAMATLAKGLSTTKGQQDLLDLIDPFHQREVTPEVLADVIDISTHPRFHRYNGK